MSIYSGYFDYFDYFDYSDYSDYFGYCNWDIVCRPISVDNLIVTTCSIFNVINLFDVYLIFFSQWIALFVQIYNIPWYDISYVSNL